MATTRTLNLLDTSIGKKALMALTGSIMSFWLLLHLLGNLQMFSGPEKMNAYAAFLKRMPALLWSSRIVGGLCLLLHVITATQLTIKAWRSRPKRYAGQRYQAATLSSTTMRITGPLLLIYLIYHILHYTTGDLHHHFDAHQVYSNVVIGFSSVAVSVAYIAAMLALALHLKHGLWSVFQTFGLNSEFFDRPLRLLSIAASIFLLIGFISIPLAVLGDFIR